jgi:hypothetical protein
MELVLCALKAIAKNAPVDPREVARKLTEDEKMFASAQANRWSSDHSSSFQAYAGGRPVFAGESATFKYNVYSATSDSVNQYKNALSKHAQDQFYYENMDRNYRMKLDEIKKQIAQKHKTSTGKKIDEIWVP